MIVEFVVANYRSIKERQTFSLAKSNNTEMVNNSFQSAAKGVPDLLHSAVIYGANSAGKSNFILALDAMARIVIDSARESKRGERLPVIPFKLSQATKNEPTEFEVVFVAAGVKYQYGLVVNAGQVLEEWLFAFPNGRSQRWFIRVFDKQNDSYAWDFGTFLSGKKQLWKESTRDNSLFLSTAVMLNSAQLQPVNDWFSETLRVSDVNGWGHGFTTELCLEESNRKEVLKFLKAADLDIDDIKVETKNFDASYMPDEIPDALKEKMLTEFENDQFHEVKTVHYDDLGNRVHFNIEDESDGTRKLFAFAGPWIDSLNHGHVLFIDELHDSLHPAMVKFLVELFHDKRTNPNNAQLIFTTHETSILDQQVFSRDQVWFCEKDKGQATTLFGLTDFSPRKGAENLEKAYLSGRYGALPLINKLAYLGD